MALDLRLQQKMAQQLVMTPQLQQAIKLLQLSHLEMADVLREELQENPVLEEHEADDDGRGEEGPAAEANRAAEGEAEAEAPQDEALFAAGEAEASTEPGEGDEPAMVAEADWDSYLDNAGTGQASGAGPMADDLPSLEASHAPAQSLGEHLRWQIHMLELSPQQRAVALLLVDEINEDGYLAEEAIVSVAAELEIEAAEVEAVLPVVQQLDPRGVAARDLQECLLLQAWAKGHTLAAAIVEHCLPLLQRRQVPAIAKLLQVEAHEVSAAIRVITSFEPRPGRAFAVAQPQYITPDIYLHKVGDSFVITLNEDGLPRLRISNYYRNAMQGAENQTRSYIQDKLRSATWLMRSIHMRQRTIYKVMESILRLQRDFFERGVGSLRPLILKEVAEDVQMHESTISRVTTNKYVHTPQGIYELKYFFNSSIHCAGGDHIASESVRNHIERLIREENPAAPHSDQKLVELLRTQRIDIARRTVAKYREMLRIPSSSRRKRVI